MNATDKCTRTWGAGCAQHGGGAHACCLGAVHVEEYHIDRCMCECGAYRPLSRDDLYARAIRRVRSHFKLAEDPRNDTNESEESITEAIDDLFRNPEGES